MKYCIVNEGNMIRAYAEERLNFEPKDWRKEFKKDLSNAIREFIPGGEFLKAKLITSEEDFFDVENVMFYNLGTANFKKLDTKRVWFSLERVENSHTGKYIHEYSSVDSFSEIKGEVIAEWSNIIVEKPTTSRKPLDYWITFKQSKSIKTNCSNYCGDFGVSIEISKPRNEVINITNIQKPLLDGIISVFHKTASVDNGVIEYTASKTSYSAEDIKGFLSNNKIAVLPQRDIIQKYREGIKWNPQDEKCTDVRIVIREIEDKFYKISGCMFIKQ